MEGEGSGEPVDDRASSDAGAAGAGGGARVGLSGDLADSIGLGSTSVPGLTAKPILDIALGLPAQIRSDQLIEPLARLGFDDRDDLGAFGGRLFVAEWTEGTSLIHAHAVARADDQWARYLAFRDGLRANPELAAAYAELETELAAVHADDRAGYAAAKFGFVLENAEQLAAKRR